MYMKNKTKNVAKGYSKEKWLLTGLPVLPALHAQNIAQHRKSKATGAAGCCHSRQGGQEVTSSIDERIMAK